MTIYSINTTGFNIFHSLKTFELLLVFDTDTVAKNILRDVFWGNIYFKAKILEWIFWVIVSARRMSNFMC